MAFTKIAAPGINSTGTFVLANTVIHSGGVDSHNIHSTGVITATAFHGNGSNLTGLSTNLTTAIGIQSGGVTIGAGITQLNFLGVGNTLVVRGSTVDINISGNGASIVYDNTVFGYQNVINSNITIGSPYKTGTIYTDPIVTVDIELGAELTVDDGCVLNIVDI